MPSKYGKKVDWIWKKTTFKLYIDRSKIKGIVIKGQDFRIGK